MHPLLCATALLFGGFSESNGHDDQDDLLRHLRVTYSGNRAAFTQGVFRFRHTQGRADDATAAREGRFEHGATVHGLYAFRGDDARFDQIYDDEMLRSSGPGKARSPLANTRLLTDGQRTFSDLSLAYEDGLEWKTGHQTQISEGELRFQIAFDFPLSVGRTTQKGYDLGEELDQILAGKVTMIEIDSQSRLDGHDVVRVVYEAKFGRMTTWIDPARGAIPLQAEQSPAEGGRRKFFFHDDYRACPGGGWLPWVRTFYDENDHVVTRLEITEAVADRPPDPSLFALDFPEPIKPVDSVKKVVYKPRKRWSLRTLPAPTPANTEAVTFQTYSPAQPRRPEMPGERPPFRWAGWLTAAGIASLVLTALAGAWWIRARRTRA